MSYRSFKRVLGETNLERKCLLLFAACLFLLITGAFWYAETNAERLVQDITRKTGQGYVNNILLRQHYLIDWKKYLAVERQTPQGEAKTYSQTQQEHWEKLISELYVDLADDFEWTLLAPEGARLSDPEFESTRLPDEREARIIEKIRTEFEEQIRGLPALESGSTQPRPIPRNTAGDESGPAPSVTEPGSGDAVKGTEAAVSTGSTVTAEADIQPLTPVSFLDSNKNEYYYYQPVYWADDCIYCHWKNTKSATRPELRGPLRVVKVTLPNREAELATVRSRSILLATAIITVFLSVTTLYLVVRYVVVKPLNHLIHVSDEISRGNTDQRAEIQTNDEFEDLAASFNRMVRHLVETQGELQRVNKDLDAKLDQLAQANMQLHEMNRLKSDFLATMSHELRTPLNSIIGFSDVLKGIDTLNGKQQRYVDNIGRSGRVLLEMINEILDLAKMESGRMEVRLTEFSIAQVVKAQCDLVHGLSEEKNIDLEVQIDSDLPMLYQDQAKVQQILTNLLSNAIKFTPEGGRIVVSAKRGKEGFMRLSVTDTGVGIAEEDQQVIFEKFRQGTSGNRTDQHLTRRFSGTGLGLSIVRELCRLLGGEIEFQSELGKGSTFTAELPLHRPEQPSLQSSLSARLEEVTKPQRVEMLRTLGKQVPFESGMGRVTNESATGSADGPPAEESPKGAGQDAASEYDAQQGGEESAEETPASSRRE